MAELRRSFAAAPRAAAALAIAAVLVAACSGGSSRPAPSALASLPPATLAPSASPTEPASPAPSDAATPAASPSASTEGGRFIVPLTVATPHRVTATVIDQTGFVTGAGSGDPSDGSSVAPDAVRVTNDGPRTLVVTWSAGPCDSTPTVHLAGSRLTVVQPPCQGDAIAFDRVVRLELAAPLDASTLTGVLQPGGDTPG